MIRSLYNMNYKQLIWSEPSRNPSIYRLQLPTTHGVVVQIKVDHATSSIVLRAAKPVKQYHWDLEDLMSGYAAVITTFWRVQWKS